ncbi:MAG: DUF2283 domain-containing protein [Deltaproteobacteria bacterium]|nr:DUF2283 domain-containing protein [Deltaproteobacteria bacterium]
MRIAYYPDTDSMYIDLSAKKSSNSTEVSPGVVLDYDDSTEVSPGVVLDYDEDGNLVGIDIDNASKIMDLKELVLSKLPINTQTIAA